MQWAQSGGFFWSILRPVFASLSQAAKLALNRLLIGLDESALTKAIATPGGSPPSDAREADQEVAAAD